MRLRTNLRLNSGRGRATDAGFTLVEVLAALLFMAIVIPVAVEGLHVASLAGTVAQRKGAAARVAERILNESIITTNWNKSFQSGTAFEGDQEFRWTMRNDTWDQDAMRVLTVEVKYSVQNRDFSVNLTTLVSVPQTTTSGVTQR